MPDSSDGMGVVEDTRTPAQLIGVIEEMGRAVVAALGVLKGEG